MNRQQKQIFYASFYLLTLVVIWLVVYILFFKPAPTCFDNKLNQKETEVDCGGSCVSCEIKTNPIKINSLKIIEKKDFVIVLLDLRNESTSFGANRFLYDLTLNDISSFELYKLSGDSFIYPGQARKLIVNFINKENVSGLNWIKVNYNQSVLNIDPPKWQRKESLVRPDVTILNYTKEAADGTLKVEGRIANNNNIALQEATIIALVKDSTGNIRDIGQTVVSDLNAFSERPFFILTSLPSTLDISDVNIEFVVEAK